jgi:hypothetical protein
MGLKEILERMKMKIIEQSVKSSPSMLRWVIPLMKEIGSNGNFATTIPLRRIIRFKVSAYLI